MGTAALTAPKEVLQPASKMNKFLATTVSATLATEATLAMAMLFPTPLPATPASPPPPPLALLASPVLLSLLLLEVMLQLDVTSPTLLESSMLPRERLRLTPTFSATLATQAMDTPALAMLAMVVTTAAMGLTLHQRV